ncbi:MAG TPA: hypothetical protein VMV92_30315 [Streptosporangiaceae bacterium]|nr:hypothetical protein [Streptosporangiaceae bacterium]
MPWRWVCWSAGAVLLVLSGVVLLLQVAVHGGAGTPSRACGSAWDVVAGRAGWPQWWAADLSDPAGGRGGQLVRTLRCPGAVNGRIVTSGGLALGAVALVSAGELVALRSARRVRPALPGPGRRLRLLGTAVTILGALLTAGGLAGITMLVADPRAPLFLYVSRPVVVLAGLLLILPAILLIVLGRGASLMADYLAHAEATREAP